MLKIKEFFLKKFFSKKNIKWLILLLMIIIVCIFFFFRHDVDEVKIEDHDLYQYLTGIKIEYTGKIKINKNSQEITKISFDKESVELDSTPIYYKDDVKVIFPKNMSVVYPILGTQYKIMYYSTVYKSGNDIYVKDGDFKKKLNNAIIYDGNDLYFLATDCNVSFGGESYDLKAMSYIIVDTLNSVVQIYDRENDEFLNFEGINQDVIISNNKIKVNAKLDLMYYNDKSRLLLKTIDNLNKLS